MKRERLSVLVPTLNEEGNVAELIRRLCVSLEAADIEYEIIFIDDHSKDGTRREVERLSLDGRIFFYLKQGKRGKAFSILEGFKYARYETIAMIDADLQYPPEAIPEMVSRLHRGADVIVANRVERETSLLRRVLSWGFSVVFSKFLHGLNVDVQSGLKVFRSRIAREVSIAPDPWTFDLEFLLSAKNYGYVIEGHPIVFAERVTGDSKIVFWRAIGEIGWNALKLKFRGRPPLRIHPQVFEDGATKGMIGAGVAHRGKRFETHSTLPFSVSAMTTFLLWQKALLLSIVTIFVFGIFLSPIFTMIAVTGILTSIYFLDMVFNVFFVMRSLKTPPEISFSTGELSTLKNENLPVYSILCPLYREAHILPGFLSAIGNIEWPKEKLEVLLLLEENDEETILAARELDIPSFVRIVVVPHAEPKTKPKACNFGLSLATGEYVVIYDAEDVPDPLQLKKAYLGFQTLPRNVWCLQAKLNYFNSGQNILTRLFTAEYSLWFDVMLPGLQSVSTSIPLGGTSNHFRREDLIKLEGWDPFNVTEDCDLGARIFARGFRTAIIDSTTLEEANSRVGNWIRQRSRWIKGYMQTYLVHMREPIRFFRENGIHALLFQFIVGGKIAFMLVNPFLWLQTILYFSLRPLVGSTIESFYPNIVFYMAVTSLVFGNFLALYYYMIGCAKRGKWELMKWVFLIPFYWLLVSIAALLAAYQLFVKPHYWEKTTHGLHVAATRSKKKQKEEPNGLKRLASSRESIVVFSESRLHRVINLIRSVFQKRGLSTEEPSHGGELRRAEWNTRVMPFFGKAWRWAADFALSAEGFFVGAMLVSSILNFLFNAFLGRVVSFEYLGEITLLNTLWYLALVFINPFATTINREISFLSAKNGEREARYFWAALLRLGLIASLFAMALWLFLVPSLQQFFHVDDLGILVSFAPLLVVGLIAFGNFGYLQGSLRFRVAAIVSLFEAGSKLFFLLFFVRFGLDDFIYLSILLSVCVSAFVSTLFIPRAMRSLFDSASRRDFPVDLFFAAILSAISTTIFTTVDLLLAKHFMSSRAAGEYALLSLVGKIVFFLGTMPNLFMVTFVARYRGLGKDDSRVFRIIYFVSACVVVASVVIFGFFGDIFSVLLFGDKVVTVDRLLPAYTAAIGFFTLSTIIVTYHLARKQYVFTVAALLVSCAEAVGMYIFHYSIDAVVYAVLLSGFSGWALLGTLHVIEPRLRFIGRAFRDFLGAFQGRIPEAPLAFKGKRILIFNWRDTRHSYGGGAEVYVEEIAKRWVREGHAVTIFCGNDGISPRHEMRDGIRIVRRGGFYLVYVWAIVYYFARFRGKYDVILDCENGIPFFTPLYAREPIVCLLHHVHQDVFFRYLPKPLAFFAAFLEKRIMPIVYANTPFVTVSESSKKEMEAIGIGKSGIQIVHPGVRLDEFFPSNVKSDRPTVLYLGRLKAYKSVDVLLRAFRLVIAERPEARLIIAGDGDDIMRLRRLAFEELRLGSDRVQFLGYVNDETKRQLLQDAWMLVNPSMMEGWGIVAIEANACGTPVVASDVPGLRDSVESPRSGFLVPYGDHTALAEKILLLVRDRGLREEMNVNAREWAKRFDWNVSSKLLFNAVSIDGHNSDAQL